MRPVRLLTARLWVRVPPPEPISSSDLTTMGQLMVKSSLSIAHSFPQTRLHAAGALQGGRTGGYHSAIVRTSRTIRAWSGGLGATVSPERVGD
jgi:hypothetical protein